MFQIAVICLVLTALLAYLNARFVGLPSTIGVMAIALLLSLGIVALDAADISNLRSYEEAFVTSIDFSEVLMQGMLSLLLFAGALHVDLRMLRRFRMQVALLAILGTVLSMALVGIGLWAVLPMFGLQLSFAYCLVFGALISPTDPIAVIGILKSSKAPKEVGLVVAGESLFNDGVGVVLFAVALQVALKDAPPAMSEVSWLFIREGFGGIALGGAIGWICYRLLRSINNYQVEVLLTLAAVLGGYELAHSLHVSGPLAMVVAGLVVGNQGRAEAMSDVTRQHVDIFWELVDEILNAVLFVLLGLEIVVIAYTGKTLGAAFLVVGLVLIARLVSVGLPILSLRQKFGLPAGAWKVLTWGGLRGGISVALALSLPASAARDLILSLTYGVVLFSILVQGLTIRHVIRRSF